MGSIRWWSRSGRRFFSRIFHFETSHFCKNGQKEGIRKEEGPKGHLQCLRSVLLPPRYRPRRRHPKRLQMLRPRRHKGDPRRGVETTSASHGRTIHERRGRRDVQRTRMRQRRKLRLHRIHKIDQARTQRRGGINEPLMTLSPTSYRRIEIFHTPVLTKFHHQSQNIVGNFKFPDGEGLTESRERW